MVSRYAWILCILSADLTFGMAIRDDDDNDDDDDGDDKLKMINITW